MLYESLREKMSDLRKSKKPIEKSVLSVVIGDADTLAAKNNSVPNDEQIEKIIRKVIESNHETLNALKGRVDERITTLNLENEYLSSLLPQTLSVEEIIATLSSVELKTAKSDGMATGIANKHLKSLGLKFLGADVAKAVQKIRSQP